MKQLSGRHQILLWLELVWLEESLEKAWVEADMMLSIPTILTPMSPQVSLFENLINAWPTLIQTDSSTVTLLEDAWALETLTMLPKLDFSVPKTVNAIIMLPMEELLISVWICGQINNKFLLESLRTDTSFGDLIKTMVRFINLVNWISVMVSMSMGSTVMLSLLNSLIPLDASWELTPLLV